MAQRRGPCQRRGYQCGGGFTVETRPPTQGLRAPRLLQAWAPECRLPESMPPGSADRTLTPRGALSPPASCVPFASVLPRLRADS